MINRLKQVLLIILVLLLGVTIILPIILYIVFNISYVDIFDKVLCYLDEDMRKDN